MALRPMFALCALVLIAGCFSPTREADCLLDGTCDCKAKSDCASGKDCVNGHCVVIADAGIGELGWPCADDAICLSKTCLPKGPGNGQVCTVACDADAGFACPRGWECKSGRGGFFCNPPIETLCQACTSDTDCNALGDRCLGIGAGRFCGKDCSVTNTCPSGFSCRSSPTDGGSVARQCVPDQNSCECGPATQGLKRSCKRSAPLGTCFGFETCGPGGAWSGCDARDASVEICDGIDNDCNGLTDGTDPGLVTTGVPGWPDCRKGLTCTGKWYCGPQPDGGASFQCSAPSPQEEACNGADDDCNGVIDDGLLDLSGNYVTARACGSCATDCYQVLQHLENDGGVVTTGAATCELRGGKRTCVPQRCAKGFFASPTASAEICQQAITSQCRPCTTSGDCQVPGDQCVTVGTDPGTFCAQSCDPGSPYAGCTGKLGERDCCPVDATCQSVNGAKLCVPNLNSCTCAPSRAGLTRSCFVTLASSTCVGQQVCDATGGFGACDTSKTTVEFCDGRDNDCDGVIDNGFINTRASGTYDTDENCGACQNDCKAKWSPSIQHAVGGCRLGVGRVPGCAIVSCTTGTLPGGGACRVDTDCSNGRTCDPTFHQCAKPCSAGCGATEQCSNGFCTQACLGDAQCQAAYGAPSTCTGGVCAVPYQFVNADNEETNGCECAAAPGVDEPDVSATYPTPGLPAVDRNCDGVDGTASSSLYVWALSPSSRGTRTNPYRTIAEAIAAFRPGVHTAILVAQGSYVEQVVLRDGVSLYGGYASTFLRRDVVLFPTLIEAAEPAVNGPRGSVNAENLTSRTVLAGFTIRGYDVISAAAPGVAGRNSYGVYVKNSPGLVIQNNHVVGGRAGDASPAPAGTAGANGGQGADGVPARECQSTDCTGETQPGGASGVNLGCPANTQGNPGAGADLRVDPQQYGGGLNGRGGANAQYQHAAPGQAAFCKYDCTVPGEGSSGGAAQNGGDGAAGAPGAACLSALGLVTGDDWVAPAASSGSNGSTGRGGGGGGAGGCVRNLNPASCTIGNRVGDLGATGGGGGAGGCGGGRGAGAASGGSSFAIFVVGGVPAIDGNLIDLGFGGRGGPGGSGGYGGLGGQGGRGGQNNSVAWCAGPGGPGGRGGNGGAGSGGGGGCGGSVFGVGGVAIGGGNFGARNTLAPSPMNAAGLGGQGGASPAGPTFQGGDGAPGVVVPVQSF